MIDCVIAPFDQRLPVADEDVKTTLPPSQKVVIPPAEIVGAKGNGIVEKTPEVLELVQFVDKFVAVTLYVPGIEEVKLFTFPGLLKPTGTVQLYIIGS